MTLDEYFSKIGPGVYSVQLDVKSGEYGLIWKKQVFEMTDKLYGVINKRCDRILDKFDNSKKGTSALLHGLKGTGKSVLSKLVANRMIANNYPVVLVEDMYMDTRFKDFIERLGDCCLIFDEFTVVYKTSEAQGKLLGLLDGMSDGRRLIMMTTNDIDEVIDPMENRPGRVYFNIEFGGLTIEDTKGQLDDGGLTGEVRDLVEMMISLSTTISWDIVGTLVVEYSPNDTVESYFDKLLDVNVSVTKFKKVNFRKTDDLVLISPTTVFYPMETWLPFKVLFYFKEADDPNVITRRFRSTESYVKLTVGNESFIDVSIDEVSTLDIYKDVKDGLIPKELAVSSNIISRINMKKFRDMMLKKKVKKKNKVSGDSKVVTPNAGGRRPPAMTLGQLNQRAGRL